MISQPNQSVKASGSIFIGIVKDNADPEKLGRLKVLIPTYNDNTSLDELQWCNYCQAYGGYKDEGFFFLPAVGAEVVVMFPMGAETPIWIGCLSKKGDNPGPKESTQEADEDHYWQRKQLKTRVGWVMFDDKDEYITIKHNCGSFITLDKNGDINIRAERHVNIKAGKSVNISAEKGDVCLEALHSFKIEAHENDFTIEAVKGKMSIAALADNLFFTSGKNIKSTAEENITTYANKNIYVTAATESVHTDAKKNIENYAQENIKSHSDKETLLSSKENMAISSSADLYQYVEKAFKATAGEAGVIQYGQSTDIIVKSGDFNITSASGQMKLSASEDMTISSKQNISCSAEQDFTACANQNIKTMSKSNTEMFAQEDLNMNVLNNMNATACQDYVISGKMGLYLSSTDVVDVHAGMRLYEHTPMQIIQESGVQHQIKGVIKTEQTQLWTAKSDATTHNASGNYTVKGGMIMLN